VGTFHSQRGNIPFPAWEYCLQTLPDPWRVCRTVKGIIELLFGNTGHMLVNRNSPEFFVCFLNQEANFIKNQRFRAKKTAKRLEIPKKVVTL
jgi:hypothetical protein